MFFLLGRRAVASPRCCAVAGFIEDFDGDIRLDARRCAACRHKRDFGMVFQNYALFPHLSVAGNVAFGLEARHVPAASTRRVDEALEMVGWPV